MEIHQARRNIHLEEIKDTIHKDGSEIGFGTADGNNPTYRILVSGKKNHINY